jgi:hypothetical protein
MFVVMHDAVREGRSAAEDAPPRCRPLICRYVYNVYIIFLGSMYIYSVCERERKKEREKEREKER